MDQHHWRSGAMVFIVKLDRSGVFLPDFAKAALGVSSVVMMSRRGRLTGVFSKPMHG